MFSKDALTLLREGPSCSLGQQHAVHVPLPHDGFCHLNLLAALLFQGLQLSLGPRQTHFQLHTTLTVKKCQLSHILFFPAAIKMLRKKKSKGIRTQDVLIASAFLLFYLLGRA